MADNITLNPGSGGSVVASDDISGVQHQLVKLEYGADGSATQVSETSPLPARNPAATSVFSAVLFATGTHTVDLNANLGRNATTVILQCVTLTSGDCTVALDLDGSGTFTNPPLLLTGSATSPLGAVGQTFKLEGLSIDSLQFVESGTSSEITIYAY